MDHHDDNDDMFSENFSCEPDVSPPCLPLCKKLMSCRRNGASLELRVLPSQSGNHWMTLMAITVNQCLHPYLMKSECVASNFWK